MTEPALETTELAIDLLKSEIGISKPLSTPKPPEAVADRPVFTEEQLLEGCWRESHFDGRGPSRKVGVETLWLCLNSV